MRMERIAVNMPHSTTRAFRRYAQIHDLDLYVVAKMAVTEQCRMSPSASDIIDRPEQMERMFISLPDTAMRLLEMWSSNTGIPKGPLMEWSIRTFVEKDKEEEATR